MIARHFVVTGRVQGVAFRWSTKATADRLGVRGWVRNRPDGSVEGWAEGEAGAVEALVAWLERGPGGARVASVTVEEAVPAAVEAFQIRS
jgi:acylphosphatase